MSWKRMSSHSASMTAARLWSENTSSRLSYRPHPLSGAGGNFCNISAISFFSWSSFLIISRISFHQNEIKTGSVCLYGEDSGYFFCYTFILSKISSGNVGGREGG